eukprot:IDg2754t1
MHKIYFNSVVTLRDSDVLATESRCRGHYSRNSGLNSPTACLANLQLWHERMRHVNQASLLQMARKK